MNLTEKTAVRIMGWWCSPCEPDPISVVLYHLRTCTGIVCDQWNEEEGKTGSNLLWLAFPREPDALMTQWNKHVEMLSPVLWRLCNPQAIPVNWTRLLALFAYISSEWFWAVFWHLFGPLCFSSLHICILRLELLELRKFLWGTTWHSTRLEGEIKFPSLYRPVRKANEKGGTEGSFCCVGLGADFLFQGMQEEITVWDGENRL